MVRVFAIVALACIVAIGYGWPSADDPISDDERSELLNDLKASSTLRILQSFNYFMFTGMDG